MSSRIANGSGGARGGWDLLVSPWHLDEEVGGFPIPAGAITLAEPPAPSGSERDRLIGRYRGVADTVARADRPLILAGDCLTAVGVVVGLQRQHRDLSVIWLDAHGDFNTPAISTSGYLAGMSLAMLTGRAPEPISERLGLRPVPDDHTVLVDARDLDPAEREALEASRVRRWPQIPTPSSALSRSYPRATSTCTSMLTSSTATMCPASGGPPARAHPSRLSRS